MSSAKSSRTRITKSEKSSTGRSASSVVQKPAEIVIEDRPSLLEIMSSGRSSAGSGNMPCFSITSTHHGVMIDSTGLESLRSCWQETLRNQEMGNFQVHMSFIALFTYSSDGDAICGILS